ncbi:MAG: tetratricopeptide repeat protein [Chitinophagaceae bacterium]|nr:tetratricopeptide repeat protein [Chitinophagaceae bacterium]
MKNHLTAIIAISISFPVLAQQTAFYTDPETKFQEAKAYFQKEQYSLAYPLLKELKQDLRETNKANTPVTAQEIEYYSTVCALKQNEGRAEDAALEFIEVQKNNARVQMMHYHLGEFYFRQEEFANAIRYYEGANIANLSNREIADMKFHQGYSYFALQRFNEAKPLFNSIRNIKDDPNYLAANYYYGFLAFRDKQYGEALESFRIVENEKNYGTVVPYYIAQIYYIQGKKDEAISYIQQKLQSGSSSQYYDLELKQLIGHAYFEKKEYAKALPYLEDYVGRSKKVRREDLYELSYSYYQAKNYTKSIDGFKQLSGKDDSLSQHAMYLLGDAYLKTGQKSNARNAFLFCSSNSSNPEQREIARYQYAKLSYELGYQDEALNSLSSFIADYPASKYNTEAKELMIDVLANTNNYKDAQAMLETLKNPSENSKRVYPRILFGRATEMINDGRLAEADGLLNQVLEDPYNRTVLPYAYFWKGEIGYRNKQLDTAIKYFHAYMDAGAPTAGEANPVNAKYNLGYSYLRKENFKVSVTFFEPLIKAPALNTDAFTQDAYLRTADNYFMMKNYDKARSMYDNAIKLSWPAEDYATFQIAMLAGVRSANEKISGMNTMIRKFPKSPLAIDANMEIANTYMGNEKFREAIPYLKAVAENTDNSSLAPQAVLKLGTAYYNIDNNEEALRQYKFIVDRYPSSAEAEDALDNIKTIYVEDGKPDEYAAYMRQIGKPLSADTEDELTWAAAEKLYDDQKLNEALNAYNSYIQRFPSGAHVLEANFNRAEIYNTRKDWNNAVVAFEAVAAQAPNPFAERAILSAARINFFELKNYAKAETFYAQLKQLTSNQELKLEAMRGLLRCQYNQQKWTEASANAKELTASKGSSADDKTLANMVIAKSAQVAGQYNEAINAFKSVVQLNKAALAAEARYEIASCWFQLNKLSESEKAAFETISKSGSYDYWITKAYILLGDIYFKQKDYFNAKATFQSVVENTTDPELKSEAQEKLNRVNAEDSQSSKVGEN